MESAREKKKRESRRNLEKKVGKEARERAKGAGWSGEPSGGPMLQKVTKEISQVSKSCLSPFNNRYWIQTNW